MRITAKAKRPQKMVVVEGVPLPAPVSGWDAISPLANMPVDRAFQLDNWVCRPGWIEPRRGSVVQATGLGTNKTPVQTLMAFNGFNGTRKIFGVAGGTIYDCTAVGPATPTTMTGLQNSRLQYIMFSNASQAQHIIACNGADGVLLYDGTTWSKAPITGDGIDPTQFIQVNAYQQRLWFVQNNSTDVIFLTTVGGIQGAAQTFPLGQLMTKGGFLMAIGTWTVDTRQNVDEYIAFMTSRGEVIVFAGTDPTTASTFQLVGRYQIGSPIERRCFLRISGDLMIITVDGVVGMSEMLSTDRAAANRVSLTSIIMNQMALAAQQFKNNFGWQLIEFPLGTLAILNIPMQENAFQMQFVMNTIIGAWSRFIGIDPSTGLQSPLFGINANCWEVDAADNIFWGGNNGTVFQWNVGSGDGKQPICCIVKGAYNSFGNAAQLKRYTSLQALITASANPVPSIGIDVDFKNAATFSTEQPVTTSQALWNQVKWGQFNWGNAPGITNNWLSPQGIGHYVSVWTKVTTQQNPNNPSATSNLQLNGWNILAERGAFI
ncbi:MAG: hypothetical protein WDN46_14300 [Methylocella sp.]